MQYLVITLSTTEAALLMEEYCMKKGIPGRLIPVPPDIHADCGLAFRAPVSMKKVFADKEDGLPPYDGVFTRDFRF